MAPPIPTLPTDGSQSPSASRFRRTKSPQIRPGTIDIFSRSPTLQGKKSPKPIPPISMGSISGASDLFPKSKDLLRRLSTTEMGFGPHSRSGTPAGMMGPGPNNTPVDAEEGLRGEERDLFADFDGGSTFGLGIGESVRERPEIKKFELPAFTLEPKGLALRHSPSIKAFIKDLPDEEEEEEEEEVKPLETAMTVQAQLPPDSQQQTEDFDTLLPSLSGPIYVEYESSTFRLIPPGLLLKPNHLGLEVLSGGFHIGEVLSAQGSYKAHIAGEFNVMPGETFVLLGIYQDGWGIGYRRLEKHHGKIPPERFYEREAVGEAAEPCRVDIALLALLKDVENIKGEDLPCVKIVDKYKGTTSIHLAHEVGVFPLAAFRNNPEKKNPFKVILSPPGYPIPPTTVTSGIRRIRDDVVVAHRFSSLNLALVKSIVRGEAYEGYVPNEVARCLHMLCSAGKLKGEWWEEQTLKGDGRRAPGTGTGKAMQSNMMPVPVVPCKSTRRENVMMDVLAKEGGFEGQQMDWVRQRYAAEKSVTDILDKFQQVKSTYILPKGVDLPGTEDQPPPSIFQKTLSRSTSKITGKLGSIRRTLSVNNLNGAQAAMRARSRLAARRDSMLMTTSVPEESDPLAEASSYLSIFPSRQNVQLQKHFYATSTTSSQVNSPHAHTAASSTKTTPFVSRANTLHSTVHPNRRRKIPDDLFQPLGPEQFRGLGMVSGDALHGGLMEEVIGYLRDLEGRIVQRFEGLEKAIAEGGSIGRSQQQRSDSTAMVLHSAEGVAEEEGLVEEDIPPVPQIPASHEQNLLEWRRSRRSTRRQSSPTRLSLGPTRKELVSNRNELNPSRNDLLSLPMPSVSPLTGPKFEHNTKLDSPGVQGWKRARASGAPLATSSPEKFQTPEKSYAPEKSHAPERRPSQKSISGPLDPEKVGEWEARRRMASTRGRRKARLALSEVGGGGEGELFSGEKLSVQKTYADSEPFSTEAVAGEKAGVKTRPDELSGQGVRDALTMNEMNMMGGDEELKAVAMEGFPGADFGVGEVKEVRLNDVRGFESEMLGGFAF